MSEESKKIEKIEQEAKQEVKAAELSEQDLDKVAGGAATITSTVPPITTKKYNVKSQSSA
jgi:hypothetical protein